MIGSLYKKLAQAAWAASFLGLQVELFWVQGRLPGTVATHFNWNGVADRFESLSLFVLTSLALSVAINGILVGISAWIGPSMPRELLNWPWKDYWFANRR